MTEGVRLIERVLVVEDDVAFRSAIARSLRSAGFGVLEEASTAREALERLASGFDLVLLDVRLPDGSGVTVAEAAWRIRPAPLIVCMSGEATAKEAFTLAQLGVLRFITKPFAMDELLLAIQYVKTTRVRLEPLVKSYVGVVHMRDVQAQVRRTMLDEALAIAKGNRTIAARLVRVSRQAIQNFIRANHTR